MSTYNLKGINIYQDRIYLYGSSRLGELVPHKKSNSLCGTLINDNDLIGNRSAYIESFLKNVFVNVNNPNFTSQAITFWINHWDAYFHVHSNQFSVEANNMATHQFMWNEWVAWLCKLNRFETLNEQIFSLWDAEWQTRMEPFISHQINCSQETCPEMYLNLLPLWRTNEELMITAWEGLGYTNNYNLRRNTYVKGSRHYELSNHLGNVLTVVSDRKIEHDERYAFAQGGGYKYENGTYHLDASGSFAQLSASDGIISSYTAELISATDYYAFGAPLPGRTWQGGEYRFGFNGQEKDNEVAGVGNIMTAEFWEYDTRLGRRWNCDPAFKLKPWMTSYHAFGNKPIYNIDPNGALETKYQDEEGKEIANTNDGIDRTVTVKNIQRPFFDAAMKMADRNSWKDDKTFNMILSDKIDQYNFNATSAARAKIAKAAENDKGSLDYNYTAVKDNYGKNSWKCNKFVMDKINEAGIPAPTTPGGWALPAGEWADKNKFVKGWVILAPSFTPAAGDVAAEAHSYVGATGHTGVVAEFGMTISASDNAASVVKNDWGFRPDNKGVTVFRRYIGY